MRLCAVETCRKPLREDNLCGYCKGHRWKSTRRQARKKQYRHAYYLAHTEAEKKNACTWKKNNREAAREINRRSRNKETLEILAALKVKTEAVRKAVVAAHAAQVERLGYIGPLNLKRM